MKKNRISMTARKVAANVVTLGQLPHLKDILPSGLVDSTDKLLIASGAASARSMRLCRSPKMLKVYKVFDPLAPGQFEAFGYRKAFFEKHVRDAIAAGSKQVLVLGAGYDTLCWRLAPEFPDIDFFEIDHPPTSRSKARGIDVMGKRNNLRLIAEDLGVNRLVDVLNRNDSWDSAAQTAITAEGLIMYLTNEAVSDLFKQCAAVTGPESQVAFSYIPMGEDDRPDVGRATGIMLWLQKISGEPWLWSIKPGDLSDFMDSLGWHLTDVSPKRGVEFYASARRKA